MCTNIISYVLLVVSSNTVYPLYYANTHIYHYSCGCTKINRMKKKFTGLHLYLNIEICIFHSCELVCEMSIFKIFLDYWITQYTYISFSIKFKYWHSYFDFYTKKGVVNYCCGLVNYWCNLIFQLMQSII